MKRARSVLFLLAAGGLGRRGRRRRRRPTKIVLIAGTPEPRAGRARVQRRARSSWSSASSTSPGIEPVFVAGGWPEDESVFEGAKSVVFFMDGGGGHPMIQGERAGDDARADGPAASAWSASTTPSSSPRGRGRATSSSTGSAATTRPATRPTRTTTSSSRRSRTTRSPGGRARSGPMTSGTSRSASGPTTRASRRS